MMRLVRLGLMFGNLIEVRAPSMVERYNRALEHLTGKRTELTDFHIDISGFSPEIGDEFDDMLYLNPNGCNRQFILLSTEQKTAPLLNAQFSTSRTILRSWIEQNEPQLFALTARDAVAGEMVNSILSVRKPGDLLRLRDIEIEADTLDSHVEDGAQLSAQIDLFMNTPDAWWDEVLIADMIELGKRTGDITRNPVNLGNNLFTQGNFHSNHFGGVYVFRDLDESGVITRASDPKPKDWDVEQVMGFTDRNDIATFLEVNELVEPVVSARNTDIAAILQQKMDFIVVHTAAEAGEEFKNLSRRDLRNMARRHLSDLPEEYEALSDLLQWAHGRGRWPRITSRHPAYFYTLRSANHDDRDLVNMLLAELSPLDVRQLFICHKQAFYDAYSGWADTKKEFVANYLANEYMVDKAGARDALFGHEPDMAEPAAPPAPTPEPTPERARDDLIERVGPWGPIKRY